MLTMDILAMAPPAGAENQQSPAFMFVWLGLMMAIFYFMLIRPQRRRERERRQMIDSVKTGDRVLICGGMIGIVTNVKDKILAIKIAEKVKVEVVRGAVAQVLEKGAEVPEDAGSNS